MNDGFVSVALGAMPSFTNPNNVSVITGVPPSVHGISGNFFLNPATGQETMMDQPEFCGPIAFSQSSPSTGRRVVARDGKEQARQDTCRQIAAWHFLLRRARRQVHPQKSGIDDCLAYVGKPLPNEYSADLSLFVLEAGIRILEREKPDLMYLSLSDYIQHKYAPGSKEATEFYVAIDGSWDACRAWRNRGPDGRPRNERQIESRRFSQRRLPAGPARRAIRWRHDAGSSCPSPTRMSSITARSAPTQRSFPATSFSATAAMSLLNRQPGVELVLNRAASAKTFDLPADRIGDLVVMSDRGTVLGKSKATLDLSELGGMRLRSHGGLADRNVYLIFSRPLNDTYAKIALSRQLRNFDVFEFALNGLQ